MFLLRDDISDIVCQLQNGAIICYPTDTVWAIGCDATNEAAIARIAMLKGQMPEKAFVVLVSDLEMLRTYVPRIHPRLETLLAYHTRPLTIVYEKSQGLPPGACAPDHSAAIRVAQDEFCQTLIKQFGKPLISTIAAKLNMPFPSTFGGVSSEILGAVDYVVKYRQDDKTPHEPSSIAKLDRHLELEFLRD